MHLKHTDNLSKTIQSPNLTAADAHDIANLTCKTLEQLRVEQSFNLLWEKAEHMQEKVGVNTPTLPRKRRVTQRLVEGSAEPFFHATSKQYYKVQYYEALDLVLGFI